MSRSKGSAFKEKVGHTSISFGITVGTEKKEINEKQMMKLKEEKQRNIESVKK
jgi:hypothetical protein